MFRITWSTSSYNSHQIFQLNVKAGVLVTLGHTLNLRIVCVWLKRPRALQNRSATSVMFPSTADTAKPPLPVLTSAYHWRRGLTQNQTIEIQSRSGLTFFTAQVCHLPQRVRARENWTRAHLWEKARFKHSIFKELRPSTLVPSGLSWRLLKLLLRLQSHPLLSWLLNLARVNFSKGKPEGVPGLAILPVFSGCFLHPVVKAAECVALQLSG